MMSTSIRLIHGVYRRSLIISLLLALLSSCVLTSNVQKSPFEMTDTRVKMVNQEVAKILKKHEINTAGVAVIKNGNIAWHGYFGSDSSNIPASARTLFNVASITKTVTAETILKLASQGKISLDEPMATYWVDPDLKGDADLFNLTPRMALTHTTGFPNWRFFEKDGKLKFKSKPSKKFGYSGEGIQYLAKFVEKKLEKPFEEIVQSTIFKPLELNNAFISVRKNNFNRIAKPLDESMKFHGYYCHPGGYCRKEGSFSAAGDMVITLEDYANFMIESMAGSYLSEELVSDRTTIQGEEVSPDEVNCSQTQVALCPIRMGYGLGWNITELENDLVIGHRGSDWSSVSLAYYYSTSKDGLIIFFNAPNKAGVSAMVDVLQLLDPKSPEIHGYMFRRARAN